jgi:hypothetical protein
MIKNNLWKPGKDYKEKQNPPKKIKDEICKQCVNQEVCIGLCPLIKSVNGRAETQEVIPSTPVIRRGIEQQDYNQILYELISDQQARDADRIDTIRSIASYRIRAIAACALAYIPQTEIAKIAHISQGRISKLYRAVKR